MHHSTTFSVAAAFLSALSQVNAQLTTSCNPLNGTCPPNPGLGGTAKYDFTKGPSDDWTNVPGTKVTYDPTNGAQFVIKNIDDSPKIMLNKYIMFGNIEFVAKSSPGNGVVSSFAMGSSDLDEIDWEWVGGSDDSVQTNFYGKGWTGDYSRGLTVNTATPQETWHTYTIDWTADRIVWSVDGKDVRTIPYNDPLTHGGEIYPQTPGQLALSLWIACPNAPNDTTKWVCEWAGGQVDLSKGPYSMFVQSVTVEDYGCGGDYTYSDNSGSWQSIQSSEKCDNSKGIGSGNSASSTSASSTTTASSSTSTSGTTFSTTDSPSTTATTTSGSSTTVAPTISTSASTTLTTTKTSASKTSSSTSSSTASTVPKNAASGIKPASFTLLILGLVFGYFV